MRDWTWLIVVGAVLIDVAVNLIVLARIKREGRKIRSSAGYAGEARDEAHTSKLEAKAEAMRAGRYAESARASYEEAKKVHANTTLTANEAGQAAARAGRYADATGSIARQAKKDATKILDDIKAITAGWNDPAKASTEESVNIHDPAGIFPGGQYVFLASSVHHTEANPGSDGVMRSGDEVILATNPIEVHWGPTNRPVAAESVPSLFNQEGAQAITVTEWYRRDGYALGPDGPFPASESPKPMMDHFTDMTRPIDAPTQGSDQG